MAAQVGEGDEYDVIVVGGGPVGENAADYAVRGSDRTAAIVEGALLGGECSYYACMPSKALLRPIDVASSARHLQGVTDPAVDVPGLIERRDTWVSHYRDGGQARWAEETGLAVVRGHGRLVGEREVEVTGPSGVRRLRAREAVLLATGSTAVVPDELAGVAPWTSRDATGVREVPSSLAIVGGGVVACEAATWLQAMGSQVTLLVRDDRVLGRAEPFAGELVLQGLRAAGVDVRLGVRVTGAERAEVYVEPGIGTLHGGPVRVLLDDGTDATYAELLVATGRRPATDALGLESVGLTADDVTGRGKPLPPWLFAVGDVSGQAPLTHWGKYRARQVGAEIAARAAGREPVAPPGVVPVPQVVFTDPQVAAVGQTVAEAEAAGITVRALAADYSAASGASLLRDDLVGRVQLVVDTATDTLVGATFVGPEVAELVHAATVAIVGRVPLATLRHAVPSYPTASEIWLRLLEE